MVGEKWRNLSKMREFFKKIDLATLAGAEGKIALAPEFLEFAPRSGPTNWSALRSALQKIWSEFLLRSALRSVQTLTLKKWKKTVL